MPAEVAPPSQGDGWMGVILHEADAVTDRSVDEAERLTGPSVVHIRSSDATWPEGRPGREHSLVASPRSDLFLDTVAGWLDRVAATGRELDPAATTRNGVAVTDVAFYEWLYAGAEAVHPAWALASASGHLHDGGQLVWVAAAPVGDRGRAVLQRHCPRAQIVEPQREAAGGATSVRAVAARLGLGRLSRGLRGARRRANMLRRPVAPLPEPAGARVLLIDQYPHTARILAAATARLSARPELDPLHVGTDQVVAASGAPYVPSVDLWTVAPLRVRWQAMAAEIRASRAGKRAVVEALANDPFLLGPLGDLVGPSFAAATGRTWGAAARHIVLVDHVLAATRPAVVVTTSLVASSVRAAALRSRCDGGPSVVWVQHGIVRTPRWKTRYVQDAFLAWGERARRKLIEVGVDPQAIEVCGSSQFEAVTTQRSAVATDASPSTLGGSLGTASQGGAPTGAPVVLYLPSRSGGHLVSHEAARVMRDMVVLSARTAGARVVIKPHPGDRSTTFEGIDLPDVDVRVGADLVQEILAADVVVVATSTAGLEACALGKPVVALAPLGVAVADEYVDYGAALIARDLGELAAALTGALDDAGVRATLTQGRAALVDDMFHGLRPGVSLRITESLARHAGAHEPAPHARS